MLCSAALGQEAMQHVILMQPCADDWSQTKDSTIAFLLGLPGSQQHCGSHVWGNSRRNAFPVNTWHLVLNTTSISDSANAC